MKCFYHNDADGHCSAFWVKDFWNRFNSHSDFKEQAQFFEMDYSKSIWDYLNNIQKNETIFIVDFSIPIPDLAKLQQDFTKNIVFIDHHKTAISTYEEALKNKEIEPVEGIRYNGIAASMLCFIYLHFLRSEFDNTENYNWSHNKIKGSKLTSYLENKSQLAPLSTKLIADYDVWKWQYKDITAKFISAFNSLDTHPDSEIWNKIFVAPYDQLALFYNENMDYITSLIKEGEAIERYKQSWSKNYMPLNFEATLDFEGNSYNCLVSNIGHIGSKHFDSITNKQKYDILSTCVFNGVEWTVSLYTEKDNVDTSIISKSFGGEGHQKASGFRCKELPFNFIKQYKKEV